MLPLSGIKVVELATGFAGPYGGMVLADWGAEVIKVEKPEVDPDRNLGQEWGAAIFIANNRNKKSVALKLESREGKDIMQKLLKSSDVFLEGLALGAADRLGFSYEAVSKMNPKIVYCSIKGYGEGPYRNRPPDDVIINAESGFMSTTGEPEPEQPLTAGHPPVILGPPVIAFNAGLYSALAVMVALINREKTGKGEYVSTNLFESAIDLMSQHTVGYSATKKLSKLTVPVVKTKDGWVAWRLERDAFFQLWCDVFGVSGEIKTKFATAKVRDANPKEVDKLQAEVASKWTTEEMRKKLLDGGIPGSAINTMKDIAEDPHLKATKNFVPLTPDPEVTLTPDRRTALYTMLPIRTSDYNPDITGKWTPAPKLGKHTVEVLSGLGYTDKQIADLRKRRIVWP